MPLINIQSASLAELVDAAVDPTIDVGKLVGSSVPIRLHVADVGNLLQDETPTFVFDVGPASVTVSRSDGGGPLATLQIHF